MSRILLIGAGLVAYRAAQQLVGTTGVDEVLIADRDAKRAEALAARVGGSARACSLPPEEALESDVHALAIAVPARAAVDLANAAVDVGLPTATVTDEEDGITALLALDGRARRARVSVVVGCGLAPGAADVLARHAASLFDEVDEVHVARVGSAGPWSVGALHATRRARALEIVDGVCSEIRRSGEALVWFPDPIGARDCVAVGAGVRLVAEALPGVQRATVRFGEPDDRAEGGPARLLRPRRCNRPEARWGGARAEVWGWRGGRRDVVVYGLVDQTDIAAGTTLAVTAAALAGVEAVRPVLSGPEPGARGLGTVVVPSAFLAELARRGVRAATFEGNRPVSETTAAPGNIARNDIGGRSSAG